MIDQQMRRAADLLAVIHRDDGSYTAEHGWERSCADAARKVCQLRVDLDAARQDLIDLKAEMILSKMRPKPEAP